MTTTAPEQLLPPFSYFGGKVRIAQQIVKLLPRHEHYVEVCGGSLAVLLAKHPSRMETANDIDGDLVHFWRMLRERPEELIRACALTPHARAEHADSYHRDDCDDIERARRTWVCVSQGRSGVLRRTGWRHYMDPNGSKTPMPAFLATYIDRMTALVDRLANVSLENRPALDLIRQYGTYRDVLLYVDPPYLGSTRYRRSDYRHDMRSDDDHRALADALHATRSAVVLSGYPSPLYAALYADWHRVEIQTTSSLGADRRRTEVLWSNRPIGQQPALWDTHDLTEVTA